MEGSYIPKGTKIIGDVYAEGDLELDGDVIGNVNITGNLPRIMTVVIDHLLNVIIYRIKFQMCHFSAP